MTENDSIQIPEVLIIVEGGLIAEIHTTAPRILVHVIDHDNLDIGLDPIERYELITDTTSDGIRDVIASAFYDYLQGEEEVQDDSWNF